MKLKSFKNRKDSGLSTLLLLISLFVVTIIIICIWRFKSSLSNNAPHISVEEVRRELGEFIQKFLDHDQQRILSLDCGYDWQTAGCTGTEMEKADILSSGSNTWKLDFYSALYQNSTGEEKQHALDRSLELSKQYFSNNFTPQTFVYANAYRRTGNPEFLRMFFFSAMPFIDSILRGNIFNLEFFAKEPPMNLIRYAEQLLQARKFLLGLPAATLQSIKFEQKFYNDRFEELLADPSKLEVLLQGADKILKIADQLEISPPNNISNVSKPFLKGEPNGINFNACWGLLGYAKSWELTGDARYLESAKKIIARSRLEKPNIEDIDIFLIQPLIGCMEGLIILGKSEQVNSSAYKNFFEQLVGVYLDSKRRPICMASGGVISIFTHESGGHPENLCRSNSFTIADNAFFYSTIANLENFTLDLKNPIVEFVEVN